MKLSDDEVGRLLGLVTAEVKRRDRGIRSAVKRPGMSDQQFSEFVAKKVKRRGQLAALASKLTVELESRNRGDLVAGAPTEGGRNE